MGMKFMEMFVICVYISTDKYILNDIKFFSVFSWDGYFVLD